MNVFWSYARNDNHKPAKRVSRLKNAFLVTLKETTGDSNCKVFFDVETITWGAAWKTDIEEKIKNCDGLIATLTPSFFNSRACIYEVKMALEHNKSIYPIYFRTCRKKESNFKEDGGDHEFNIDLNVVSKKIGDFQPKNFRNLRNKDIQSEDVQDFIDKLAEQISV